VVPPPFLPPNDKKNRVFFFFFLPPGFKPLFWPMMVLRRLALSPPFFERLVDAGVELSSSPVAASAPFFFFFLARSSSSYRPMEILRKTSHPPFLFPFSSRSAMRGFSFSLLAQLDLFQGTRWSPFLPSLEAQNRRGSPFPPGRRANPFPVFLPRKPILSIFLFLLFSLS